MTTRMPSAASAFSAVRRRGLDRIGDGEQPGELAVDGDEDRRWRRRRADVRPAAFSGCVSMPSDRQEVRRCRAATGLPSTVPIAPLPVGESKSATLPRARSRSLAARTMAAASGCSLARSTLAASRSTSSSSKPAAGTIATTVGLPSVSVPVLSTTSVSTFSMRSSASAFLISTPACAPRPTPTMIDIGVARPSAQGQAMISTLHGGDQPEGEAAAPARTRPRRRRRAARRRSRPARTSRRPDRPAAGSARGERCASATICTICASIVSRPTFSARMTKPPDWLSVPPITLSPASLVTGIDSPVTIDSSSEERPSSTAPSTGTFSPGRTRSRSPTCSAIERDLVVGAVGADAARGLRREIEQRADRAGGRLAGAQFQHLAEQHQHGDDRGRLEIDGDRAVMAAERRREDAGRERGDDAVEP